MKCNRCSYTTFFNINRFDYDLKKDCYLDKCLHCKNDIKRKLISDFLYDLTHYEPYSSGYYIGWFKKLYYWFLDDIIDIQFSIFGKTIFLLRITTGWETSNKFCGIDGLIINFWILGIQIRKAFDFKIEDKLTSRKINPIDLRTWPDRLLSGG